jgi:hypothetical protein
MQYDPLLVDLSHCENLIEILEFPREIDSLHISYCPALKIISKWSNILEGKESKLTRRMKLIGCDQLCNNLAHDYVAKMKCRFKYLPDDSQATALLSLFLTSCRQSELEVLFASGSRVPEWFTCRTDFETFRAYMDNGLYVYNFSIEIPGNFKWENKGLAFCAQREKSSQLVYPTFKFIEIYINGVCIIEKSKTPEYRLWRLFRGYVWLHYMPFDTIIKQLSETGLPPLSICEVQFVFRYRNNNLFRTRVKGSCGVHVVMPEDEGAFVNGS